MNEEYYLFIIKQYSEKLKKLMGDDNYFEFSMGIAKELFRKDVEAMTDCDFKDYVLENMDSIIK